MTLANDRSPSVDVRSDPELLRAVRSGDGEAWAELWLRHHEAAERAAGALTPDRAEAEDAVADTFGAVHRALLSGHGPDVHFRAYLLTAVRRAVADRRLGPVPVAADDLPVVVWHDEPAEDGPSERAAAVEAFASLPERYRTVLWHAEVEQEPLADVGRTLGLSASAVAQLLVRARRQLRRTYVQRHLDHARRTGLAPACQEIQDLLGAYVTGALAERDRTRVEAHLDDCEDCDRVLAFAGEVGAGLRACLLPGLLGSAAGARYLAGTGAAHHAAVVGAAVGASSGAASSGGGALPRVPGKGAMGAVAAAIVAVMVAGGIGLAAQAADSSHSRSRPQAATHLVTPSAHQQAATASSGGSGGGGGSSVTPSPAGRTGAPPAVVGSSSSSSSSSSSFTSTVTQGTTVTGPAASSPVTSPVHGSAAAAATSPTTTHVPSSTTTTTRPPSSPGSTTTTTTTTVPPSTTTTVPETTTTSAPATTTTTTCDQQKATIVICLTLP